MFFVELIIGIFIGFLIGVFAISLLVVSKD